MAENYGLPYTGSKSKIAHWVIDNLPRGRVLIDAFAGGCAITSNWTETIEALERGELTQKQAADRLNMPLSTFRYRLNKCKE